MRNFLLGSALTWLGDYHADGLRVDVVASMLYLDYSRRPDEWVPNERGGREDLEAVSFLRELNEVVHRAHPGSISVAEESTAWPGVFAPDGRRRPGVRIQVEHGVDARHPRLLHREPIHRRFHHDHLTFGLMYAFSENFVLPLSHDEVVHGKRSLLTKMPGDRWQQLANLRALYGYMWAHPGKKLLFMGGELAQEGEWNHDASLDWEVLQRPEHAGVHALVRDLNRTYRAEPRSCGSSTRTRTGSPGSRPTTPITTWSRSSAGRPAVPVASSVPPTCRRCPGPATASASRTRAGRARS